MKRRAITAQISLHHHLFDTFVAICESTSGPMYYKGWYHFFYQYNPNGAVWGDIVWGHAVSRDMIHWFHLPLAMVADQWYDKNGVWTGSATILPDGQVIMLYTGSTNESMQVPNVLKIDKEL